MTQQNTETATVPDPGSVASRLIATTRDLANLIERENHFLKSHEARAVKPLQAEKSRLATQYQDDLKIVKGDKSLLGAKGSLLRLELKAVTEDFQEALKNHGRILLRKKYVGEGMIHAIGAEVDRQKKPVNNYSPDSLAKKNMPTTPTSIALNEVI